MAWEIKDLANVHASRSGPMPTFTHAHKCWGTPRTRRVFRVIWSAFGLGKFSICQLENAVEGPVDTL